MKRAIISIDEKKCTGCGDCIPGCPEGALLVIDGKARLISDLFCDGLGSCVGHCPTGAMKIETRDAEPYDEKRVMEQNIVPAGANVIAAHHHSGGCPGSRPMDFSQKQSAVATAPIDSVPSALRQWPIQLHLVSPEASYFHSSDLLLAADCTAFAVGDFHGSFMRGKSLAIACPKLDSNMEIYVEKLVAMIDMARLNTITVTIMEVPCCGGLMAIVDAALRKASRKVPVKKVVIGVQGDVLSEEWV